MPPIALFILIVTLTAINASGIGDVLDQEEQAHPWEAEDLQQHHKDERLFDSVVANDLKLVEVSLKIGAHHHHHKNGYTPLMMATWLDHSEICAVLLKAGAHLEQKDKYGRSALAIASIRGSEKCGIMLVESGADLSASARDSHHNDVVGHAEEAARHPDAVPSARRLSTYLKNIRDSRSTVAKEAKMKLKAQKKNERAEKRAAAAAEDSASQELDREEEEVGL